MGNYKWVLLHIAIAFLGPERQFWFVQVLDNNDNNDNYYFCNPD